MPLSRVIPGNLFAIFFICSAVTVTFAAEPAAPANQQAQQKWIMSKETDKKSFQQDPARARLIIFREKMLFDPAQSEPVNILINKIYHASLLPGHDARTLSLCPGSYNLDVSANTRRSLDQLTPVKTSRAITLAAGEVVYYAVSVTDESELMLSQMAPAEANSIVSGLKTQTHTISRFSQKNCPGVAR